MPVEHTDGGTASVRVHREPTLGAHVRRAGTDLEAGASPAAAQLVAARERFLAREFEVAMQAILESVAADRDFRGGLARRAMLLCFVVVGEEDERLDEFRRRLATLLY